MIKVAFKNVSKVPEDIFMINRVEEETMLDVQYALSSHESLVKFVKIMSVGLLDQEKEGDNFDYTKFFLTLNESALGNVVQILKMLMGKIFQTDYDNII